MKKTIFTFFFAFLILSIASIKESKACVDPDPTKVIIITINYDTLVYKPFPFIFNVEFRASNLRLMDETPNKFCSCGFIAPLYGTLFDDVSYVAFVDSGTNNPYNGFSLFDSLQAASDSWTNTASGNWSGYISDVINGGLKATSPVELVVRFKLDFDTAGYTLNGDSVKGFKSLKNDLNNGVLGTDEWNVTSQSLVNAHRGLRSFYGKFDSYNLRDTNYFNTMDSMILNHIPVDTGNGTVGLKNESNQTNKLYSFPNPFGSDLNIGFELIEDTDVKVELYSIDGKRISVLTDKNYNSGKHQIVFDGEKILPGMYFLKYSMGDVRKVDRLIHK